MVHGAVSCLTVATDILKPQKAWGEDFSIFLVAPTELAASKTLAEMKPSMAACFVKKTKTYHHSVSPYSPKKAYHHWAPQYKNMYVYIYIIHNMYIYIYITRFLVYIYIPKMTSFTWINSWIDSWTIAGGAPMTLETPISHLLEAPHVLHVNLNISGLADGKT